MSSAPEDARPGPMAHTLREYALLADGERGALVGPQGDVAWMCAPRFEDPAVFSALLGGRSRYRIAPAARCVWGGNYEPGTLVWRNRWVTDDGAVVQCRDALALPADPGRVVLLRRIGVLRGRARLVVDLDPRAGFDRDGVRAEHRAEDGTWTMRTGDLGVRWTGAPQAVRSTHHGGLCTTVELEAGQEHDLVLEVGPGDPRGWAPAVPAQVRWQETEVEWAGRVPRLQDAWSPSQARHSLAVLHGLTSAAGAMVAAATTSLPERFDGHEDYDYRYAWVRDQCYAGLAAYTAGDDRLGDSATRFLTARLLQDGARLAPAYTADGDPVPGPGRVHLPGYPGADAGTGNQVRTQFQLDAFGEALQVFAAAARRDRLDEEGERAARAAVDAIAQRWREPDAGVWELQERQWTHSKLAAVAGLRAWAAATRAASPARHRDSSVLVLADQVLAEATRTGLHPSGRWQRAADDERVDAALLLAGLRGAVPLEDPRTLDTLAAVQSELSLDGYVFRYRHDARPLPEAEGAFLLCSYWTAMTEAQLGQPVRAVSRLEKALAAAGPPQLFSEEFDPEQHQLRGNLPQGFVHALALEACVRVPDLLAGRPAR
ncbi:glycoside hydrolase family 15 protein [Kineococcus sp. LSe6-4]|uniref:Glycoside hydrolase family 15 protein n=1 Tax=Kineococcus halophytocola TaxID=3234027 RepID=A0ABV4H747_9ACTN